MVNLKHFLTDLQQGAYLDAVKDMPPEVAQEISFKRSMAALYLYYMALLLLSAGVLARLSGPLQLDFLKASLLTGVIPYFFYRHFLGPLIIKKFDFVVADADKAKCEKLYRYFFAGSFGSFAIAIIIVFLISTKSL